MKRNPRIGLLPLYLRLYDDTMPERREPFGAFLEAVAQDFDGQGIDVVPADVCRLADEFRTAMDDFEKADVDCIATLHLAYSPSEESIDVLVGSNLPIVILDTTMDHDFGLDVDPARLMHNHGIHGVMDMACMLRRRGKAFQIVAGHVTESNVMERAADMVRAAYGARCLKSTKALRIGESFKGMGDFSVEEGVLRDVLGIDVTQVSTGDLATHTAAVTDEDVEHEMAKDHDRFDCEAPADLHERSTRICLGLRRMLDKGNYSAFSMNFLAFDGPDGPTNAVPFMEASKAMARGIGYAGEGDVLTASFVGALARAFGNTTFTEIFCPDWKGNSLFLSHMGEINPDVIEGKARLIEKPFSFTPAQNPAALTGAVRPGPATYVNLAPGPNDTFSIISAPVEMLGDGTHADLKTSVRGWMKPRCPIAQFLEDYGRAGGTHHSALILGEHTEALSAMAEFLGCKSVKIRD